MSAPRLTRRRFHRPAERSSDPPSRSRLAQCFWWRPAGRMCRLGTRLSNRRRIRPSTPPPTPKEPVAVPAATAETGAEPVSDPTHADDGEIVISGSSGSDAGAAPMSADAGRFAASDRLTAHHQHLRECLRLSHRRIIISRTTPGPASSRTGGLPDDGGMFRFVKQMRQLPAHAACSDLTTSCHLG